MLDDPAVEARAKRLVARCTELRTYIETMSVAPAFWISRTSRAVVSGSSEHMGGTQTLFESQFCPSAFCP